MQTIEDQGLLPKHQGCKGNVHQLDLQEGGVCPGAISRILIQKKVLNAFSQHKTNDLKQSQPLLSKLRGGNLSCLAAQIRDTPSPLLDP